MRLSRNISKFASVLLLVLAAACSSTTEPGPAADASAGDSAASDGSVPDTGSPDAASTDAGSDAPSTCTEATAKPCSDCLKATDCRTIDNDCNDDTTCNAAENAWYACLCFARAGTGTTATCDSTFTTSGGSKASVVVQCMRDKCLTACF